MPEQRQEFGLNIAGTIATSSRARQVMAFAGQIVGVTLDVVTAPVNTSGTGAALVIDVQKNGVSIYPTATKPTLATGVAKSAAVSAAPDVPGFVAGDEITLVPTLVGTSVAGADLSAVIEYVNV